ncbi:MAG TPA: hypothetical protein VN920_16460, partial [Pyrinomonadaceae bacterium]|nr:hypothetical protein [Pyrinomonadaceae bacterium]
MTVNAQPLTPRYFHLRCGGELGFIEFSEGEPYYFCDFCEERGFLLLKSWLTEEDWERGSESFPYLPTTLLMEGENITVCEIIPNAKDGNRWLNELLNEARAR